MIEKTLNFDGKLCEERHERIEKRLDKHGIRIDKLEQDGIELKTDIRNLCKSMDNLTGTIKWFIGIFLTSFIGFFFYIVQNHLAK